MQCKKCERGGTGPHDAGCTPEARFWRKVKTADGCWEWQGSTNGRYGEIRLGVGRKVYAHRYAFELAYYAVPDGMVVMHICDNTRCVRPDHLTLGTQSDNLHDAYSKGRMPQWEKSV